MDRNEFLLFSFGKQRNARFLFPIDKTDQVVRLHNKGLLCKFQFIHLYFFVPRDLLFP